MPTATRRITMSLAALALTLGASSAAADTTVTPASGSVLVALTEPVSVSGSADAQVACNANGSIYTASVTRTSVEGWSVRTAVTVRGYSGPGSYGAVVTASFSRGSAHLEAAYDDLPVSITADGGSWSFRKTGTGQRVSAAAGRTIAGSVAWTCGSTDAGTSSSPASATSTAASTSSDGSGAPGSGSVTVNLTEPRTMTGGTATPVACAATGSQYQVSAQRTTVRGGTVEVALTVGGYTDPGAYTATVTTTLSTGSFHLTAQRTGVPVQITSSGGTVTFRRVASGHRFPALAGKTLAGTIAWTCS